MKGEGEDSNAHELVLIRRRAPSEEGGHHGGVWKIAYADFMTAMMAFFLVMWLINSTDQRVLTQVANYFNPMRLTDNTPVARGLNNVEAGEQGKAGKQSSVGEPKDVNHAKDPHQAKDKAQDKGPEKHPTPKGDGKDETNSASAAARYTEQALFNDPYGVLARIAADAPAEASQTATKEPAAGGDTFRDPFDPKALDKRASKGTKAAPQVKDAATASPSADAKTDPSAAINSKVAPAASATPVDAKTQQEKAATSAEARPVVEATASEQAAKQDAQKGEKQAGAQEALRQEATKLESEIRRLASQLKGAIPNINVTVTDDGILISLTDDYDFGMFAIASAEPRPATVVIMEKVAKLLQSYPEPLIVRGHTDGRPYRSGSYDNWRLSTARAHMATYMLVRGGVDEKRFERVEGYADRNLRIPNDPDAAQNRRIEILLRRPRP